ncbi:MAG: hypothetical protein SV062_00385, partial [Thermodesulfobacteriota bacterium]|nr:hypothetical protein [Thermodesulfobacteriota bacterium]
WGNNIYREKLKSDDLAPISFSIKMENEYNDNVFSTEDDMSSGLINYIVPRFIVNSIGTRHTILFDYGLKVIRYNNIDTYSDIDLKDLNYIGHRLGLQAKRKVTDQLRLGIDERFLVSRRPTDMYIGTNRISASKYLRNWSSPYMEYQINERVGFTLQYTFDNLQYREFSSIYDEDTEAHTFNASFVYEKNFKTRFLLNYQSSIRDYDGSSGYNKNQFIFGIKRKFNPEIKGEIFTGYETRKFDREIKGVVEDIKDFPGGLKLSRETKKNKVELSYNHHPVEIGEGDNYYTVNRLSLNVLFLNFQKIKFSNYFFYEWVYYDKLKGLSHGGSLKKRDDKLFGFDLYVDYLVKPWLTISLGYTRIERDSNVIKGDYKENRLFLTFEGFYELWRG